MTRFRNTRRISGLLVAALAMASHALAQTRDLAEPVYMSFTPDGQWLIASYYRTAMNRPGTDWAAWTVVWNTKTWEATRSPDATMPFAMSADSKWLVLGKYDRKNRRIGPQSQPALWKPGAEKPERTFAPDDSPKGATPTDTPAAAAAAAFDPSTKHVAWLDSQGTLWFSEITPETSKPRIVDQLKATIPVPAWGFPRTTATLKFTDDTHLALDISYSAYDQPGPGHVVWKIDFDAGKAERIEEKPGERKKPGPQILPRRDPIKVASPDKKLTATARELEVVIVSQESGGVIKTLSARQ